LVQNGHIPDTLTPVAAEVLAKGAPSTETIVTMTNQVTEFLHLVTAASFLEPRVVILKTPEEKPPEGYISIWDVSFQDQAYALELTGAPTRALVSFRQKQEADAEPEPAMQGDGAKAE
jgi:kynureninase